MHRLKDEIRKCEKINKKHFFALIVRVLFYHIIFTIIAFLIFDEHPIIELASIIQNKMHKHGRG